MKEVFCILLILGNVCSLVVAFEYGGEAWIPPPFFAAALIVILSAIAGDARYNLGVKEGRNSYRLPWRLRWDEWQLGHENNSERQDMVENSFYYDPAHDPPLVPMHRVNGAMEYAQGEINKLKGQRASGWSPD